MGDWENIHPLMVQYVYTNPNQTSKADFQILSHNVWSFRQSSWDPKGKEPFLLATKGEEVWSVTLSLKQASVVSGSPEFTLNRLLYGPAFTHVLNQITCSPQDFNPEVIDEKIIDGARSYLIEMKPSDSLQGQLDMCCAGYDVLVGRIGSDRRREKGKTNCNQTRA